MRKNKHLAIAALALASLALVAGEPSRRAVIDPKALAYRIQHELDHVDPLELSGWISAGRRDFRLIDLRDAAEFSEYHIPGAENISLTQLMETEFAKDETIVLYSEGGVHSAQAMFLLWAEGYNGAFMLKGGIAAWEADVLHRSGNAHPSDSSSTGKPAPKKPALREEENFRREC